MSKQNVYQVSSLPLRDVISDLSAAFSIDYSESCTEYYLKLPARLGKGQIRGINFSNGLGILIYDCQFLEDTKIEFNTNNVHPIKYLYAVEGPTVHSFANEEIEHHIEQHKCAIVASDNNSGHELNFKKSERIHIVSLEIDREKFIANTACEIEHLHPTLKNLFKDTKASEKFYHEGFFGLEFQNLLNEVSSFEGQELIRKFHLESNALRIFVSQLVQFEDDLKSENSRTILRLNELKRIEEISSAIQNDLSKKYSVEGISKETGLNANKLQAGFKYIHNKTVNDFISHKRLVKAATLLSIRELSISQIAEKVGFDSNSYFTKIFKKKYGMTPNDYRKLELGQ